jgi:hypothetical protein
VPWESLQVPHEVDGSQGTFRAPKATCALDADNDYEAVQTWLALHESPATQRTYRKEAEHLILWAIVERGRALSSLTTEDAIAYRAFLSDPSPRARWVGPVRHARGDHWLRVTGKGKKLARVALAHYLAERRLPIPPVRWRPETTVIGSFEAESKAAISSVRLWGVLRRFFLLAAQAIEADHQPLAEKLRRASPLWMRHTHATHALGRGAELTSVRDNLRHASVSTTSIYLHSDEVKRARQIGDAFASDRRR